MTTSLRFFFVLFAVLNASCSDRLINTQIKKELKKLPPHSFRQGEYQRDLGRFATRDNSARRDISIKSYDLKGEFDWARKELSATVEMKLKLLCSCQESFVVESQVEEIQGILLKNTGQALGFSLSNGKDLAIDLSQIPEEVRKRELTVAIRYRAKANIRENGEPSSLVAVDGVAGDPVRSKMVYTFSEPQDASLWMPCVNDPAYRALFSVELKMPASEMLIANGDLIRNEFEGEKRWVKYQTRYSLPTYLMAFAQGEINVATQYHGKLPVSIVTRTGLRADVHGLLKESIRQIQHFESLLVPYPFEKYMIVLVPEFTSGGIEHAGITFDDEISSSQSLLSRDVGLMSHELGHQWFGDMVTVKTWDDLWIKEGMASLLGEEAMRPYEDPNHTGRLMGHEYGVSDGDAIFDPSLKPEEKYTSGPYGRAAWLLTQIRATVGEDHFWGALRKVLTDYKFGSIGTDEFLEYFRPAGGDALVEKAKKAIRAKVMPNFSLQRDGGVFNVSLEDKEGALLVPVEMSWFSDAGSLENEVIPQGTPISHLVNDVRLLTLDPRDRHPLEAFGNWEKFAEIVNPIMVPKTEAQTKRFLGLGGHAHQRAMNESGKWKLSASALSGLFPKLNSEYAKYEFLKIVCGIAKKTTESAEAEQWKTELTKVFLNPPYLGMPVRNPEPLLGACKDVVRAELFSSVWAGIEANPASPERSEMQLYFASLIPQSTTQQAYSVWSKVAVAAPSVRGRIIGLQNLIRHLRGGVNYAQPQGDELLQWNKFLVGLLEQNRTGKFLGNLIPAIERAKLAEAMPHLATLIRSETYAVWHSAYCAAHSIGSENPEAKKVFESALGDVSTLAKSMQDFMKDPKACGDK